MLYSKTCEYAIRALTYMAGKPADAYSTAQEIAEAEQLPNYFLSKILQSLAKNGVLSSAKGPTGGFALARAANAIYLKEVVDAVDGAEAYARCAVGFTECTEDTPCPMHEMWSHVRGQIVEYLETTTLAQMVESVRQKRRLLLEKHSAPAAKSPVRDAAKLAARAS